MSLGFLLCSPRPSIQSWRLAATMELERPLFHFWSLSVEQPSLPPSGRSCLFRRDTMTRLTTALHTTHTHAHQTYDQKLTEASGFEIPPELLFTHPTVRRIAEYISSLEESGQSKKANG